jgi:hypothetical protein
MDNDKLGRIWKEAVMMQWQYIQAFSGRTEEAHENLDLGGQ